MCFLSEPTKQWLVFHSRLKNFKKWLLAVMWKNQSMHVFWEIINGSDFRKENLTVSLLSSSQNNSSSEPRILPALQYLLSVTCVALLNLWPELCIILRAVWKYSLQVYHRVNVLLHFSTASTLHKLQFTQRNSCISMFVRRFHCSN